jgi:hypothetical protein
MIANLIPSHADINKYPHHHSFEFSLRSPPPHSDEDKDLLKCLTPFNPRSQSIKETLKSVASRLAMHARYSTDSFEVPDDKTILVAVLGSSDLTSDDWMVSDFCLFHKALGGTAKQETWLTCASLLDVVKAHGPIIHGSPYRKPRRIVFDDTSKDFTTPATPIGIANSFLTSLQTAAEHAVPGDRILVIIVAHGSKGTGDITIGNEFISRDTLEMSFAGINNGVEITIVTTACYSGIWAVPFANPRATIMAVTTGKNPSFAFSASDSGFARGGFFAEAIVDETSGLLQARSHELESIETPSLGSILTKAVSVRDLTSKTVSSSYGLFGPYAERVVASVKQRQHNLPATISYSPETGSTQTAEVLGGNGELSTLFRIAAVLELPKEANFSSIACSVGKVTTQQKTAGVCEDPWPARARLLYKQFALRSPGLDGRVGNIQITRYASRVAMGVLPEKKCEELARQIWQRFRSDDQAQGIVSALGLVFGKELPRIVDWDWDIHQWVSKVDYWGVVSKFQPQDPTYDKPTAFIDWAATQCDVTVEQLGVIIDDSLTFPLIRRSGCVQNSGFPSSCSLRSLGSMESFFNKQVMV